MKHKTIDNIIALTKLKENNVPITTDLLNNHGYEYMRTTYILGKERLVYKNNNNYLMTKKCHNQPMYKRLADYQLITYIK